MKHNNSKFNRFWRSISVSDRKVICEKAGSSFFHVEQIAAGGREMNSTTFKKLRRVEPRITIKMCFPEEFK